MDQLGRHDASRAAVTGDEYVAARERRRALMSIRAGLAFAVAVLGTLVAFNSFVVLVVVAGFVLCVVMVTRWSLAVADRRAMRSETSEVRSCPARLPVGYARRYLPPGRYGSDEMELPGRIAFSGGDWTWTCSGKVAGRGVGPVFFGQGWQPEIRRTWGPWSQSLMTLRRGPDRVDLWVRRAGNLRPPPIEKPYRRSA